MIDFQSERAVYQQLADVLRGSITSGAIPAGRLLPSSKSLEQTHGVSRETVRRALAVLRAEGLVVTEPSLGTRVRVPERRRQVAVPRGATIISRPATAVERAAMGLTVGEHVQVVSLGGRVVGVHPAARVELTIR
ncbi:winged helix-turn-helix domain-containing protein [Micromonospora parva]|uniref:winged helix-turn-helix domain-containing protein n=1 Tax=Micromonospora parva TaxID=1464048 RepID=UPI0033EDE71C